MLVSLSSRGWPARQPIRWYKKKILSARGKVEASGNAAAEDQLERAHEKVREVIATTGCSSGARHHSLQGGPRYRQPHDAAEKPGSLHTAIRQGNHGRGRIVRVKPPPTLSSPSPQTILSRALRPRGPQGLRCKQRPCTDAIRRGLAVLLIKPSYPHTMARHRPLVP